MGVRRLRRRCPPPPALACRAHHAIEITTWPAAREQRRLVEVPTQRPVGVSTGSDSGIFLLHQRAKYQIPKVRMCVDFILDALAPDTRTS